MMDFVHPSEQIRAPWTIRIVGWHSLGVESGDELEAMLRDAVRVEASTLEQLFTETVASAESMGVPRHEVVSAALARIRQRDGVKAGRLGERIAKVRLEKRRIPSLTQTARFRIPDILTPTELIEIKNVARLRLTHQLIDFARFAQVEGLTFVLVTRFDTKMTPQLRALIDQGQIEHRHLSGLLSPTGRKVIRRLIDETLLDGPQTANPIDQQ
jgi:hypothetical protein